MRQLILILLITTLAVSCKKLPVYESQYYSEELYNNEFFDYYDVDSKIRYEFYNDDTNLYLKFDTYDMLAKMKILHGGLKICIDTLSKKTISQYIQYPLSAEKRSKNFEEESLIKQFEKKKKLSERIDDLPKIVEINNYKGINEYNLLNSNIDFNLKLFADKSDNLVYELKIPLSYFFPNGIANHEEYSIGIVTGELELPKKDNMGGADMPSNNRQIGGMRPSGGSGMNQRQSRPPMASEFTQPIKIWFKTNFASKK